MNHILLRSKKFKYVVKFKSGKSVPQCQYPREIPETHFRLPELVYIDENNMVTNRIIYPKEFCFQYTSEDDIIENEIIQIKDLLPDWVEINVLKEF